MKIAILLITTFFVSACLAQEQSAPQITREHIRVIHQDISKWDKNGDGKLTGRERDAFTVAKRKEIADVAVAIKQY